MLTPDSPRGVTSVPFWRRGVPQHCLGPPFLLQHSNFISSPAPNCRGDALWSPRWLLGDSLREECQDSRESELAASILPQPRGCSLLSGKGHTWAGCACADTEHAAAGTAAGAGWALPSQMPLQEGREGLAWPFHVAVV